MTIFEGLFAPLFDPPREITHMRDYYLLLQLIITTSNHETKESTSAARGEREDGFERRERRTFGAVFEDS